MGAPTKRIIPQQSVIKPQPARALVSGNTGVATKLQQVLALRPLASRSVNSSTPTTSGNSGSNVLTEPIGHLIQHIKQYDPRLYEALQRLGNQFQIVQQLADAQAIPPNFFNHGIDIFDSTVGDDIAPWQPMYGSSTGPQKVVLVRGLLRKTVTDDLTLNINSFDGTTSTLIGTFTIPLATVPGVIVDFTTFSTAVVPYGNALTWDIKASDGQKDKAGVATYEIWWEDNGS